MACIHRLRHRIPTRVSIRPKYDGLREWVVYGGVGQSRLDLRQFHRLPGAKEITSISVDVELDVSELVVDEDVLHTAPPQAVQVSECHNRSRRGNSLGLPRLLLEIVEDKIAFLIDGDVAPNHQVAMRALHRGTPEIIVEQRDLPCDSRAQDADLQAQQLASESGRRGTGQGEGEMFVRTRWNVCQNPLEGGPTLESRRRLRRSWTALVRPKQGKVESRCGAT